MQILREEGIDLFAGLDRQRCIHTVEVVAPGSVLVNLIFELFAFELEGLDEMFDLEVVDVLIVGVRMNEERRV
jgi:hypothetical protein